MPETHEVQTKLTLDDAASTALEKISEGFEHVGDKAKDVGREFLGMAKQAAAVAVGFQLSGMVDSLKEFGTELVHGAEHLENQKKELQGMIALSEKGEMSMSQLGDKANELNERFERLGIQAGVSKDSLVDAFDMISSRSTRGADATADMVERMTQAARVLPGGMDAMAAAWRDLEAGILRPKNALVTLMRQTGVVSGTAKSIAGGLNKMLQAGEQEKVVKLAEQAIDRMAGRVKNIPPTFGQVVESLKGIRDMFMETMGGPMLRAIVPAFDRLRQYLMQHREEIERLAQTMGEKVGQWVTKAAQMIQEGFEYLQAHSKEIFDAIEGGASALKSAVAFLVDHKDLIIGMMAGKAALGVTSMLGRGTETAIGAGKAFAPIAGQAAGLVGRAVGEGAFGVGAKGMPGGMGVMGGIAAGLGVADVMIWKQVFDQASALEQETGLSTMSTVKHLLGIGGSLSSASDRMQNFNAVMRQFAATTTDVSGETAQDLKNIAKHLEDLGQAAVSAGDMTQSAYESMKRGTEQQLAGELQRRGMLDQMAIGAGMGIDRFTEAFRAANDANSQEALKQARNLLTANDTLRFALVGTVGSVDDAIDALKKKLTIDTSGASVKLPPINFSGPITIRQEFRDQDADRVLIAFRKDLTQHAVSRIQSRTGSPFGFVTNSALSDPEGEAWWRWNPGSRSFAGQDPRC